MKFSMIAIAATALAAGVEGFSTVSRPAIRVSSNSLIYLMKIAEIRTIVPEK